jgi:hypothetical protein
MILIAGDSWSAGEWKDLKISTDINNTASVLLHNGLTQYLQDADYQVINLGCPGGSNSESLVRLKNFLDLNQSLIKHINRIFVFKTEWTRDFSKNINQPTGLVVDKDYIEDYQTLKDRVISRFYCRLSEIGIRYNKMIHLIGGCSDAVWFDNFCIEHPQLEIACQSLTNLLLTGNSTIDNPTFSFFGKPTELLVNEFKKLYTNKDLEKLLDDIDLGHQRHNLLISNPNFFYPDGTHPNRAGHQILFNFLKNNALI